MRRLLTIYQDGGVVSGESGQSFADRYKPRSRATGSLMSHKNPRMEIWGSDVYKDHYEHHDFDLSKISQKQLSSKSLPARMFFQLGVRCPRGVAASSTSRPAKIFGSKHEWSFLKAGCHNLDPN